MKCSSGGVLVAALVYLWRVGALDWITADDAHRRRSDNRPTPLQCASPELSLRIFTWASLAVAESGDAQKRDFLPPSGLVGVGQEESVYLFASGSPLLRGDGYQLDQQYDVSRFRRE